MTCFERVFETETYMTSSRLEAFSDGVIAIIITIMVLELKVPHVAGTASHTAGLADLKPLFPVFLSYILSFLYVGIYWNNHHHLFQAVKQLTGGILWANLHLLFWLSLLPFATGWMGANHFAAMPTAVYGMVLLMASIAFYILQKAIIAKQGADSPLAAAFGEDCKGKLSMVAYLAAIPLAFLTPWISNALYAAVAVVWLVPDRRIERVVMKNTLEEL